MAFHVTTRVPPHLFCLVLLLSPLIRSAVARRVRHGDSDFHEPEPPPRFSEDEPRPEGAADQQPDIDRDIPAYDVGVPALDRPPRPVDEDLTSMAEESQPPDDEDAVASHAKPEPSMYEDRPPRDGSGPGMGPESFSEHEEQPHAAEGGRDSEPDAMYEDRPPPEWDVPESHGPEPFSKHKEQPFGDEPERDSEPPTMYDERPAHDGDIMGSHGPHRAPHGDEPERDSEPPAMYDERPAHDGDIMGSRGDRVEGDLGPPTMVERPAHHLDIMGGREDGMVERPAHHLDISELSTFEGQPHGAGGGRESEPATVFEERPHGAGGGRESEPATVFEEHAAPDWDRPESHGLEPSSKYKEHYHGHEAEGDSGPAAVYEGRPAHDGHGPEPSTMDKEGTAVVAGSEEDSAEPGGSEKRQVPMECLWFTESMRKCKKTRLSGERFQYMLKQLQNTTYRKDLFNCLTEKSGDVPDNMYCTDKRSVHVVTTCVKVNIEKQDVTSAHEIRALIHETKKCLSEIHREKMHRLKRPGTRHRRHE